VIPPILGSDDPLVGDEAAADVVPESLEEEKDGEDYVTTVQRIASMGFSERLKAAIKGTREMRAILIRDANKLIAASVLSSPKVSEQEIEAFSRMATVSEDILRIIGSNRAWLKSYAVVVGLARNPKTPIAVSMNLMSRLNERDLTVLSIDRNVPDPLRVAARRKVVAAASGR
jgi:hypothetical protein